MHATHRPARTLAPRPRVGTRFLCVAFLAVAATPAVANTIRPADDDALRRALAHVGPGDEVVIPAGTWRGGHHLVGLVGTAEHPIRIRGEDPVDPPVFRGGGATAFQLSDCAWIELRDIVVEGFPGNGINVDDGGTFDTPTHHVLIERVEVRATGPRGNHDGIKLSGLEDFVVRGCRVLGWGGSAIDMVGCRRGVVEDCRFEGRDGCDDTSGVQMKGGTEDVLVQGCTFLDIAERSINLGGSTGLPYFRPAPSDFEARRIQVGGNVFVGSRAPVAFVTAQAGAFRQNTILFPERWVLRILQESTDERFRPCREGRFEQNLVVFDARLHTFVNVGPGTRADTFVFRENAWFDVDGRRRPQLPTEESKGLLQPHLEIGPPVDGIPHVERRDARLEDVGAAAWRRPAPAERPTSFAPGA